MESFPGEYAEAVCLLFGRCWEAFADGYESSGQSCASYWELALREYAFSNLTEAVAEGRVEYRAEKARACLDAIATLSCEADLAIDADFCEGLFAGSLEPGADCTLDAECAGGMQCKVGTSCPGTCGPHAALGEACTEENRCEPGLSCLIDAEDGGTCILPTGSGESCTLRSSCSTFYTCLGLDSSDPDSTGTCEPRDALFSGKLDDPCAFAGARGVLCEPNLVCQHGGAITGVCREPVGSGEACVMALPEPCPAGEYCRITSLEATPFVGMCSKSPAVGEACDNPGGFPVLCPVNAYCDEQTGLCEPLKRSGES
ncbi:MAG TPA: hypothetical protein VEX18_15270, partial [Polyangiaceae bacterium]|nr:hypothetical protein [Polyangiaceae bacterium]